MADIITKRAHQLAAEMIKEFEDFRAHAYPDPASGGHPWTIGWGSTHYTDGSPVKKGDVVTKEQAEEMLAADMAIFERGISQHIPFDLNDHMDAALISFAYNLGLGALYHSTLLKRLLDRHLEAAADEFLKWDHAAGKQMPGLTRRRKQERALFLTT